MQKGDCICQMAGESTCKNEVGSGECEDCIQYIHSISTIFEGDYE